MAPSLTNRRLVKLNLDMQSPNMPSIREFWQEMIKISAGLKRR